MGSNIILNRYRKNNSWMFWGSFAGIERGPGVFWEADRGKMTSEGYRQRILPLVVEWHRNRQQETGRAYLFMHDNTPVHKAPPARDYLMANGIQPISWPAYSTDLNPIENVWGMMKLYIQNVYPEFERGRQRSKAETRRTILEAWYYCTTEDKLRSLILSMSKRCEEVVRVQGGPTSYKEHFVYQNLEVDVSKSLILSLMWIS
ncbi:hypothetical protein K3495_g11164 [Podosphaera aphanis]|nr:hypothetical protein K3495_g11164 [Podosphaera aphanis]